MHSNLCSNSLDRDKKSQKKTDSEVSWIDVNTTPSVRLHSGLQVGECRLGTVTWTLHDPSTGE